MDRGAGKGATSLSTPSVGGCAGTHGSAPRVIHLFIGPSVPVPLPAGEALRTGLPVHQEHGKARTPTAAVQAADPRAPPAAPARGTAAPPFAWRRRRRSRAVARRVDDGHPGATRWSPLPVIPWSPAGHRRAANWIRAGTKPVTASPGPGRLRSSSSGGRCHRGPLSPGPGRGWVAVQCRRLRLVSPRRSCGEAGDAGRNGKPLGGRGRGMP